MPHRVVTLFEHQYLPYDQLGVGPPLRRERLLDALERTNHAAGREILRLERKGLRAGALVGMLRVGDLTIEILPKIETPASGAEPGAWSASRNLLAMLDYAYELPLIEQETLPMEPRSTGWFDLLTRLFAVQLHRQIHAGLSHSYLTTRDTSAVLRGRWDVQRQLQRRGQIRHPFEVIYDDYSPDIPLNQVFRYVIEQLYPLAHDASTRQALSDLRERFSLVSLLTQVPPAMVERITFNQLNERFRPAFNLARLFLSGEWLQLTHGSLASTAFLMDMNALFEQFTAAFLDRHRGAVLPTVWQDLILRPQSKGASLYLARSEGRGVLRLRPDLLFLRAGQPMPALVADTKYKLLDARQPGLSADPGDLYQMLAYAVRLKCPRGMLIYPQAAGARPLRRHFRIDSAGLDLVIATINLHVPLHPPGALIDEFRAVFEYAASFPT